VFEGGGWKGRLPLPVNVGVGSFRGRRMLPIQHVASVKKSHRDGAFDPR
jgi:hypothetical protein